MMKTTLTFLLSFLMLTSYGQVEKGKFLTTGSLHLRNFYEEDNKYKKLEIGVVNKTGYFLTSTIVGGLQLDYTWTRQKIKRYSTLQQDNSRWYEKGMYNKHEYAIGLFADKYFKLGEKLYTTVGVYGQYYSFNVMEKGKIYNGDDVYVGVSYEKYTLPSQIAQVGLSNSLIYFLNERFGINCQVAAFNVIINRSRAAEFDLHFPIMKLGIQYHFPK